MKIKFFTNNMKFRPYHKIKQFSNIIRQITETANFNGFDNDNLPIYRDSIKPILTFTGTVKLHGTNAGVCYHPDIGVVTQKRSSLIKNDAQNAHMGFNNFVTTINKDYFEKLMHVLWLNDCKSSEQITLYGEWAGSNIQKGVAIAQTKKAFYAFGLKVYNPDTETEYWADMPDIKLLNKVFNKTPANEYGTPDNVHSIYDFETFSISIDFNNPKASQNKLVELTNYVEKECPVARKLGVHGIGEGIVWTCFWNDDKYIFKTKGKLHSSTKTKTIVEVDPILLKNVSEFVEYACTRNRIMQGIQEISAMTKRDTGKLIKWVENDILIEEFEALASVNLEWKDVSKACNIKITNYFFKWLHNEE